MLCIYIFPIPVVPNTSEATADSVIKRPPGLILPQINLCLIHFSHLFAPVITIAMRYCRNIFPKPDIVGFLKVVAASGKVSSTVHNEFIWGLYLKVQV